MELLGLMMSVVKIFFVQGVLQVCVTVAAIELVCSLTVLFIVMMCCHARGLLIVTGTVDSWQQPIPALISMIGIQN